MRMGFLFMLVGLALTGCQTPRHVEFERVKQGMRKDGVLEAVGNPNVSRRWQGKDRWIYDFPYHPDGPQVREVHFEEGKAVYVGRKVVPEVTAEEQDSINANNEREWAALSLRNAGYRSQLYGVGKVGGDTLAPPTNQFLNEFDANYPNQNAIDRKFMESVYGTQFTDEKSKRVPVFEEVQSADEGAK